MTTVGDDEDLRWRRLLPYRTVEVVDENDQPLPSHQLGQIRGLLDNNFTGYLNDSDASASFVSGCEAGGTHRVPYASTSRNRAARPPDFTVRRRLRPGQLVLGQLAGWIVGHDLVR